MGSRGCNPLAGVWGQRPQKQQFYPIMTEILKINKAYPDQESLKRASDVLAQGGVIAGPTQTFYGLMAAYDNPSGLKKIIKLKGRGTESPFLLLLDNVNRVHDLCLDTPHSFHLLSEKFWPGPLTLLLKPKPDLDPEITPYLLGPSGAIGLRVEGMSLIRDLVSLLGRAITGTSANPTGLAPASNASLVSRYFGEDLDLILDCGPSPGAMPSSIVDLTLMPPVLLRSGVIPIEELKSIIPEISS